MQTPERVFYASGNGDERLLSRDNGVVVVRHQPNLASGGQARTFTLKSFLADQQHSAQNQALRELIATLFADSVIRTEEPIVKIYDHNNTE